MRQALALVKAGALGGLASVLLVGAVQTHPPTRVEPAAPVQTAPVLSPAVQERCAAAADRPGTRPPAVVRTASGRLRVVSFETGWAVYTGRRPGHLVAVCNDPSGSSDTTQVGHPNQRELTGRGTE
ncbi:hypothetical protein [Nocardioides flavescens]|uniref:Secreted protein n=1 Tax=Nocardioides flavescens TaxID=2691959 RepID=A0A6L7ETZ4_9ACTN|nr:hypothetical protein [Nocardioides flavescens]MXG89126.1 hypothetical protein [Nocardioides flavescens]